LFHVQLGRRWGRFAVAAVAVGLTLGATSRPAATSATMSLVAPSTSAGSPFFVPGVVLIRRKTGVQEADLRQAAKLFALSRATSTVEKVQVTPGQERAVAGQLVASGLVELAEPDYVRRVALAPDDPLYPDQWALPKVNAPAAWQITTGRPGVTVAVIDTGFDLSHPDRPINLIAGPTYSSLAAQGHCAPEGVNGPQDDYGHGTHVTGIIAAAANNGIGVVGLAPDLTVLVIKAGDCQGQLADSDVEQAIAVAESSGARVINLSFGGTDYSTSLEQSIEDAWNKGIVVVAAAGNQASSTPYYPAAFPNVVAVAATDSNDNLASFSSFGPDITIAAPGVSVLNLVPPDVAVDGYSTSLYASLNGTSMATPHVAAVAGLILSVTCGLTAGQVVSDLEQGATPLGVGIPNWSFGYGRLDAAGAFRAAGAVIPPVSGTPLVLTPQAYFPFVPHFAVC
jgi:subtilisin family serine protease